MTSLIENDNENYAAALQIDFTIEVCIEPRKQERLVCYEEEWYWRIFHFFPLEVLNMLI